MHPWYSRAQAPCTQSQGPVTQGSSESVFGQSIGVMQTYSVPQTEPHWPLMQPPSAQVPSAQRRQTASRGHSSSVAHLSGVSQLNAV